MKKLLKVFQKEVFQAPPLWFMRQAGRYLPEYHEVRNQAKNFIDFCQTPSLAAEATLQPLRRFDLDGAIIFSDILIIPHALGQKVSFVTGEGPQLDALQTDLDLKKLSLNGLEKGVTPTLEALGRVRTALPPDKTLIGFAGAPWTVMSYMIEGRGSRTFDRVRQFSEAFPQGFQDLTDLVTNATTQYLLAQIEAGAEMIQIFESWAALCPESLREQAIFNPTAQIVRRLKEVYPHIPVIGFAKGVGEILPLYQKITGVDGLSLDPSIDISWAREALDLCPVLQGGLDPQVLLRGGPELDRDVRRYLEGFKDRPYIFNLGHGILPQTPIEHVQRVIEIVKEKGE